MGLSALVKVCVMDGLIGDGLWADKHTHICDDGRPCHAKSGKHNSSP